MIQLHLNAQTYVCTYSYFVLYIQIHISIVIWGFVRFYCNKLPHSEERQIFLILLKIELSQKAIYEICIFLLLGVSDMDQTQITLLTHFQPL